MLHLRWGIVGLLLGALSLTVHAQSVKKRDAIVIFKDGFFIKGRVNESVRDVIFDRASGMSFPVLSGNFFIDDHVRSITFSPTHVQKVLQFKPGEIKEPMQILRMKSVYQPRKLHSLWAFDSISKWTERGERFVTFRTGKGNLEITQKIAILSPRYMHVAAEMYNWNLMYSPQELGPELIRPIMLQIFSEVPDLKKLSQAEKMLQIAAFMQEAGWDTEAEKELGNIIEAFPKEKRIAEQMLEKLKKERAEAFVESIEKAASVGQHQEAIDRLDGYDNGELKKLVAPKHSLMAIDLKNKYAKSATDIERAKGYLQELPGLTGKKNVKIWTEATEYIVAELNHDTIGRLATFLDFAQQFAKNHKDKKPQQQSAEEVLAIAVTGWLQGDQAAEPDAKTALKLAGARAYLLSILQTDADGQRTSLINALKRDNDLPIDVMAKLLRMVPPANALDAKEINTKVQTVQITLPSGNGGSYLLQLPPDYHHQRSYPVLMLLNGSRDTADDTLKRFSAEAAKHGFILAAPLWSGNSIVKGKKQSPPGAKEHALVCDTLLDLRRRLSVDSDRVFLFGWEDGGTLAFDVGLGHPDLFAGVAPMCGTLSPFTRRFYWPNAQYLPFYVIEGEGNGAQSKMMRELFKEYWTREPFVSMYVEYKGRSSEWFGEEIPKVMRWMSAKKRHTPMKEMGVANLGGGPGVDFRSTRTSDSRFYWLASDAIIDRCMGEHSAPKWASNFQPATFQANLSVGNKAEKSGDAKIWNQANLRVSGLKQLTFWITPGMMDLAKPLAINVNGQQVGGMRKVTPSLETLLEEVYRTGDRQRLFVARIDLRF